MSGEKMSESLLDLRHFHHFYGEARKVDSFQGVARQDYGIHSEFLGFAQALLGTRHRPDLPAKPYFTGKAYTPRHHHIDVA